MTSRVRCCVEIAWSCLAFACSAKDGGNVGAVEQAAVSGPPQISADFPLAEPIFAHRSNAPIVAVVPGPGAYLVLADVEGTTFATHDLVATRVLANGTSADPHGVVIATAGPGQLWGGSTPAERVGDHWLVAYAGTVVPVGDDGRPGTPVALPLAGYLADMSWDGERALITTRSGEGIFVDASGTPLGEKFRLFPLASGAEGGSIALDGSNHLVTWVTSNSPATVSVTSVTSSGPTGQVATLYAPGRAAASAVSASLTAGNGTVLAQYVASPPSCALGGRCTPPVPYYRILTSAPGGAITVGTENELTTQMSATFFGGNYLLWNNGNVVFLDQNGMPTGTPGPHLAAVSNQYFEESLIAGFALVPNSDGSAFLSSSGPLAGRVSSSFALLDDPLLKPLTFPAPQTTPVVTFDGANYLTAWKDVGRQGIHAARVSKTGAVLDSKPRPVALGDFHEPFAASSTGGSLVGWLTNNPVGAAHVATTGAVTPLDLSSLNSPYVAFADVGAGPSGYLLSLAIPVVVSDPPAMRAALLSTTGAFSAKLDFDAQQSRSSVTYDGQNYVVVWSDPNRNPREIRAARFTPSLSLLDTPPKVLFEYPGDPMSLVEMTSNGSESLVTWTDGDSIRVTRVSRELEVRDPGGIAITNDAAGARGISTVWDGSRYWIVWHGSAPIASPHVTVYGRRVSVDAVPLDATPFIVTSDLLNLGVVPNRLVDMASDAEGGVVVTYVQANTETHGNTARGRMLSSSTGQGGGGAGGVGGTGGAAGGGGSGGIAGSSGLGGSAGQGGAEAGAGGEGGNAGVSGDAGSDQGGTGGSSAGASGRGGSATGGAGEAGVAGEAGSGATSGASGASGNGNGNGDDDDDSGCSCSVPRSKSGFGAAWMFGIVVIVGAGRRRLRRSTR